MNDTATATARMLEGNLRAFAAHVSTPDDVLDAPRMAELYAYAAECVKRVPELEAELNALRAAVNATDCVAGCDSIAHAEGCTTTDLALHLAQTQAEVEQLRAKAAIVDSIDEGRIEQVVSKAGLKRAVMLWRDDSACFSGDTLTAAYAAATREGTDVG